MMMFKNLPRQLINEKVRINLPRICEQNDVVFMAIFGSFAQRKQNKKSDIDLLVKFDESKEKSLLDLIHTENEIKKIFKRKVDLLTIESISPLLRKNVMNSMRIIYERR